MTSLISYPKNSSWIELNKTAFQNNVSVFRKNLSSNILMGCVLKANAYGHGFVHMLPLAYENPIDILFVINPYEALYIRQYEKDHNYRQKRIVVLGALVVDELAICAQNNIEVAFGEEHLLDCNFFEKLKSYKLSAANTLPLKIHLFLDTGFGREGILVENLKTILPILKNSAEFIDLQGVMSHFADPLNTEYSHFQIQKFNEGFQKITQFLNVTSDIDQHIAQSSASLLLSQENFNIVRVGLSIYGLYTSDEMREGVETSLKNSTKLMPVLSWKVHSQSVRDIPKDSYIGYGLTYCTNQPTRIALLPVGYADGYPFALSNIGHVLVNGQKCKILGRVMMNAIVVDVTDVTTNCSPILATLVGQDGNEKITVDDIAKLTNTINYAVVTQIGAHLKRVVK